MVKEIAERYLLKTQLGEGRFGWVFKAKDYRTSKKVAVKVVSISFYKYGWKDVFGIIMKCALITDLDEQSVQDFLWERDHHP